MSKFMHFDVYVDGNGEWRWSLVAENGKTIADSAEGYARREDCERGIALIRENAISARVVREGE